MPFGGRDLLIGFFVLCLYLYLKSKHLNMAKWMMPDAANAVVCVRPKIENQNPLDTGQ